MAKRRPLTLADSTGDLSADASLRALVTACEAALASRDDESWPYARDRLRWVAYPDLSAPPVGEGPTPGTA